jgi:hypothetical protein
MLVEIKLDNNVWCLGKVQNLINITVIKNDNINSLNFIKNSIN